MRFSALLVSTFCLVSLGVATHAEPVNRAEIEGIVKEYLTKNPEVVVDALNGYQEKRMKDAQAKSKDVIAARSKDIFEDPNAPSVGAKDADITLVEFFDYHCGYCKHMLPVVTTLLEEDKKLRVVFREYPILSPDSELASKAALAVYILKPDHYFAFHTALMKTSGSFDWKTLAATAKKLGIAEAKLKATMEGPEVANQIAKTRELATALAIAGTPAFVVGNSLLPGAVSVDELRNAIKAARTPAAPAASGK